MAADIEDPALHVNLQDSLDGKSMAYVRSCLGLTACLVLVITCTLTKTRHAKWPRAFLHT